MDCASEDCGSGDGQIHKENHAGTMREPYTYLYTTQARTDAQSARAHTCDLQHSLDRLRLGILPQTRVHQKKPPRNEFDNTTKTE